MNYYLFESERKKFIVTAEDLHEAYYWAGEFTDENYKLIACFDEKVAQNLNYIIF